MRVDRGRDLVDGYALRIDTSKAPLVDVAEWIELERRCCLFFDYETAVHGEVRLSLKGREGARGFIEADMPRPRVR